MLFLILTILFSSTMAIVMRFSEGRIQGKMTMLAVNYISCMVLALFYIGKSGVFPAADGFPVTFLLGLINGVFYMLALVFNQKSIAKNGVVLSSVFAKTGSLLVPLLFALLLFAEVPTAVQIIGAMLAIIAIIAINDDGQKGMASSKMLLFSLLLIEGMASAMSKVFGEWGTQSLNEHFLLYTFGTAFLLSGVMAIVKKEKPGIKEILFGLALGVPNFFASRFILKALESIPAIIIYPTRGVLVILLITLGGVMLFKEKLRKKQWVAMAVILLSVALLNL